MSTPKSTTNMKHANVITLRAVRGTPASHNLSPRMATTGCTGITDGKFADRCPVAAEHEIFHSYGAWDWEICGDCTAYEALCMDPLR